MIKTPAFLGIDVGGTTVKLGVCTAKGAILARASIATEPAREPSETIDRIGAAASELMVAKCVMMCGMGVPGLLNRDRTRLIRAANFPEWIDVPIVSMLTDRLQIPVDIENDANCAAFAEDRLGAARGASSTAMFVIGTGIGGAVVINGSIMRGSTGTAGRFGHMVLDMNGPECACGQRGCLEIYASARAVAHNAGVDTATAAFALALENAQAQNAVRIACEALGAGIANVVQAIQPERIVIGGGMAAAGAALLNPIRQEVQRRVHPDWNAEQAIVFAKLGADAGWLGAALMAADAHGAALKGAP